MRACSCSRLDRGDSVSKPEGQLLSRQLLTTARINRLFSPDSRSILHRPQLAMRVFPIVLVVLLALAAYRISQIKPIINAVSLSVSSEPLPTMKTNHRLVGKAVERFFKGEVHAPEHYAFRGDEIYFGSSTEAVREMFIEFPNCVTQSHFLCSFFTAQAPTTVASAARNNPPRASSLHSRPSSTSVPTTRRRTPAIRAGARRARICVGDRSA